MLRSTRPCNGSRTSRDSSNSRIIAGMESLYYVMCWACHRKCRHCYEDRFRPYVRGELEAVVRGGGAQLPAHRRPTFPSASPTSTRPIRARTARFPRKPDASFFLGGESLIDPVRERVTYRVIEALRDKYAAQGGVKVVVQTTGDILTDAIVDDLLRAASG